MQTSNVRFWVYVQCATSNDETVNHVKKAASTKTRRKMKRSLTSDDEGGETERPAAQPEDGDCSVH